VPGYNIPVPKSDMGQVSTDSVHMAVMFTKLQPEVSRKISSATTALSRLVCVLSSGFCANIRLSESTFGTELILVLSDHRQVSVNYAILTDAAFLAAIYVVNAPRICSGFACRTFLEYYVATASAS
jgi:hypothetical protein